MKGNPMTPPCTRPTCRIYIADQLRTLPAEAREAVVREAMERANNEPRSNP